MIRQAAASDAGALRALRLEALQAAPEAFGSAYEMELVQPPEHWPNRLAQTTRNAYFVAEQAGALVGMCGVYREEGVKLRHTAHVVSVYVQPSARGQRYSGQLVNAALGWARAQPGVVQAQLAVVTSNAPAINTYMRCGFRVYGVAPKQLFVNGVFHDELLMAITL